MSDDIVWRRGRPLYPAGEHCAVCERKFHPKTWIPVDRICRDCRAEREAAAAPDPSLFEIDSQDGGTPHH